MSLITFRADNSIATRNRSLLGMLQLAEQGKRGYAGAVLGHEDAQAHYIHAADDTSQRRPHQALALRWRACNTDDSAKGSQDTAVQTIAASTIGLITEEQKTGIICCPVFFGTCRQPELCTCVHACPHQHSRMLAYTSTRAYLAAVAWSAAA